MDHSCEKCGSPVESGVPFCPHCRAPQIRVNMPEEALPAPQGDEITPALPPEGPVRWSHAVPAAALAGVLSALLMNLLFGFFGIGIVAAGALAVRIYRHRSGQSLTSGSGARIGAVSGLFGFGYFCVLVAAGTAIFRGGPELKQALLSSIEQAAARSQDPQAQAALEKLRTPEGLMFILAFSLVFIFFLFVALSALGGAVGASMSRKR